MKVIYGMLLLVVGATFVGSLFDPCGSLGRLAPAHYDCTGKPPTQHAWHAEINVVTPARLYIKYPIGLEADGPIRVDTQNGGPTMSGFYYPGGRLQMTYRYQNYGLGRVVITSLDTNKEARVRIWQVYTKTPTS